MLLVTYMDYGRAVRIARAARGMSQKQLADVAGLTASYLSLIESGKRKPSSKMWEQIARHLHVPLYLMSLLAADSTDLTGLSPEQAALVANDLLTVLVASGEGA